MATAVLATARVARIVTQDQIAARLRIAVANRYGDDSQLNYLASCPICLSVWLAPLAVGSALAYGDRAWWRVAAGSLAGAYLAAEIVVHDDM